MQAFDIDQLRTFVHAVDSGSVTAGAAQRFLSQSAASEQLRKLEDRAGQVLLVRSKAGVQTTAAGEQLLAHARKLLAMSDEAWRDLHGTPLQGEIRLGITDYFRPSELTQLLAQLGSRYPGVRLRVTICKSAQVVAGYTHGDFDVGLAMVIDGKLNGTLVRKEFLRWMGMPGAMPRKGEVIRLITLTEGCALRGFTEKLLVQRRLPFDVVHVASGVPGMQAALAAGLGVACLNESALPAGVSILSTRTSRLPALRQVSFQWLPARRGETPLIQQVRELLAQQFAQA